MKKSSASRYKVSLKLYNFLRCNLLDAVQFTVVINNNATFNYRRRARGPSKAQP
jgi:hypothetical protein